MTKYLKKIAFITIALSFSNAAFANDWPIFANHMIFGDYSIEITSEINNMPTFQDKEYTYTIHNIHPELADEINTHRSNPEFSITFLPSDIGKDNANYKVFLNQNELADEVYVTREEIKS